MTDALVIAGTYADFKFVKTRKVVQVVIEIPSEQSAHALKILGGMPNPAAEQPVAIALLNPSKGKDTPKSEGQTCVKMAHAMCRDTRFQTWVAYQMDGFDRDMTAHDATRKFIIEHCGITSRADFAINPEACEKLRDLKADFDHRDSRR